MLSAVFLGQVYALVYDSVRIARRAIPHKRVMWIAAEDIIYWIVVVLHIYVSFYDATQGVLRGYIVAGLLSGAWIYRVSVGAFYIKYMTKAVKCLIMPFKRIHNVCRMLADKLHKQEVIK